MLGNSCCSLFGYMYDSPVTTSSFCCANFLLLSQENEEDQTVADLAVVLFETATLRSGYLLPDTKEYGERVERMLRLSLNIDPEEKVG